MTIASEISRLQTDKEAMRQAIIDKGVDVDASVSFDYYAACISEIKSGGGSAFCFVDYTVVGGGGNGSSIGGGGGGEVKISQVNAETMRVKTNTLPVVVGAAGGISCLGTVSARGGCNGTAQRGGNSGNGLLGGCCSYRGGGGGAGTCSAGGNGNGNFGGSGGAGLCGYGGGGGGGGYSGGGAGCDGGGNGTSGSTQAENGKNYGGGGGANWYGCNGTGCQGVVDVCYIPDGSYGITCATGGDCCYTCNGYCVHRFTSNGTFTIVS